MLGLGEKIGLEMTFCLDTDFRLDIVTQHTTAFKQIDGTKQTKFSYTRVFSYVAP